jgi:SMI1/KNR4 family protein SUKH-1
MVEGQVSGYELKKINESRRDRPDPLPFPAITAYIGAGLRLLTGSLLAPTQLCTATMPLQLTLKRQFARVVNEPAIASFEAMIGSRLPSDYRDFLQFNGGQPQNAVFRWGSGGYEDSTIRYFFSITDESIFSLEHKSVGGSHSSNVFWDHENEGLVDDSASVATSIPLADSFQEFCEKLTHS